MFNNYPVLRVYENIIRRFSMLVLGLAGMEVVLVVVALMVLCFGFVTKTTLITQHCFGCCCAVLAQHHGFLFIPLCASQ